jgi:endonuclease/exonuclease/phosphatase family metal-dependent hydrolase
MSFGHNMYWTPPDGGERRLSSVFLATIQKVVGFIDAHNVDLMFIQETINAEALSFLVQQLNCYKLDWIPALVEIGQGFNRSNTSVRPMEMAAVVYKDVTQFKPPPRWSIAQALTACDHPVIDQHEAITELRDRFKRLPAYVTVNLNDGELLCFVTLHLPSDSQLQSLRLDAEIATLPKLAESLKQSTGADSVVLCGDFNRNPNTVAFPPLTATHWPAILPKLGVRTNTGKEAHVYDNFFLPRGLWTRAKVAIGAEEWMQLELRREPTKKASDHYPILLAIK